MITIIIGVLVSSIGCCSMYSTYDGNRVNPIGSGLFIIGLIIIGIGIAQQIIKYFQDQEAIKQQRLRNIAYVRSKMSEWGEVTCNRILDGKIAIGMTEEMVKLSWGFPNSIDDKEITKTGIVKERWIYGTPRKNGGANYIWFSNGTVSKIKT